MGERYIETGQQKVRNVIGASRKAGEHWVAEEITEESPEAAAGRNGEASEKAQKPELQSKASN